MIEKIWNDGWGAKCEIRQNLQRNGSDPDESFERVKKEWLERLPLEMRQDFKVFMAYIGTLIDLHEVEAYRCGFRHSIQLMNELKDEE